MEALPAEMIEEILVRLAVKSLLRFKCVCRRWCALIQSRSFIHRHYYHDTNQERLISRTGEYVEGRLEKRDDDRLMFSYFGKRCSYRMGAVFGLLCEVNVSAGDIVLLNPATRMVKRVPQPPTVSLLGFGLDPRSGDYNIVAIQRRAAEAYVWVCNSISSDSWKRVEVAGSHSMVKAGLYTRGLIAVFSNGVYYWLQVSVLDGALYHDILALDMKSEKFGEIKAPHGVGDVNRIVAYGDSIALISHKHELWVIWVMGKQGIWSKNWTLKDSSSRLCLLCLWKNKVLFWNSAALREYSLVDVSTGEVERVEVEPTNHPIPFPPFSFKESLVSFKTTVDEGP